MYNILESGVALRKRYEIVELVGQGGMGAVYKANDRRLEGRVCAIKEVLPDLSNNSSERDMEQMTEQFRTEASILACLDHPNLPKVSDYFAEGKREYLVMDYVAGRDLQEILQEAERRGNHLKEPQVLMWANQLLDALEYLHSQDPPIIHRDIKPSNVKVTRRGTVKLVDFGLVKVLERDDTQTVTVVQGRGTVAYTPLEQYGGDTGFTDARTDIYSLGATLYHLLAGTPPSDAKERFLHPGNLKSLSQLNPLVSPRIERAIFQALAMHPNERPETAAEMRTTLFGMASPTNPNMSLLSQSGAPHPKVSWGTIFRKYNVLLGIAMGLLLVAIILSLVSPTITVPVPNP